MVKQKRISTANDNLPSSLRAAPRQSGYYTSTKSNPSLDSQHPLQMQSARQTGKTETHQKTARRRLRLTQFLWAACLVAVFMGFTLGLGLSYKLLTTVALFCTGLLGGYVFSNHKLWRLGEISIVTALGGLLTSMALSAAHFNLGLTATDGVILTSLIALGMGYGLKSRLTLLVSIYVSILWAIASFTGFIQITPLMFALPLIALSQIAVGTQIRSGLAIGLSIITGYFWTLCLLIEFWASNLLPLTFASTIVFMIGAAHLRLGKAFDDTRKIGSNLHIYAGWTAMITGAIIFQLFWLNDVILDTTEASISAKGLMLWKSLVLTCTFIVLLSSIVRYKYYQITISGIICLTLITPLLPLMLWFPAWPQAVMAELSGMSAIPTFGVMIGGCIVAAAIGSILNGVRRDSNIMIGLGLKALIIEAFLLLNATLVTLDNVLVFFTTLLVALTIGGLIAGQSLAYQAPAPRLKYD